MNKIVRKEGKMPHTATCKFLNGDTILLTYINFFNEKEPVSEKKLMSDVYLIANKLSKKGISEHIKLTSTPFSKKWSKDISDSLDFFGKTNAIRIIPKKKGGRTRHFFCRGPNIRDVVENIRRFYRQTQLKELRSVIKDRVKV